MNRLAFTGLNLVGIAAFMWPLFASAPQGYAHSMDAPVLIALMVPLCAVVAISGKRDPRALAVLAALVAVNVFTRIPKGPSGEGFVFVLPIIAGSVFGPMFGFNLGAFSILASAIVTGGVGPWLPFQMFGVGWVGAGAGLVGSKRSWVLAGYSALASVLYGIAMTMWFWPFADVRGPTGFVPGSGLASTLAAFWGHWIITSAPWDLGRAVFSNIPGVLLMNRPVRAVLDRTAVRLEPGVAPPAAVTSP